MKWFGQFISNAGGRKFVGGMGLAAMILTAATVVLWRMESFTPDHWLESLTSVVWIYGLMVGANVGTKIAANGKPNSEGEK